MRLLAAAAAASNVYNVVTYLLMSGTDFFFPVRRLCRDMNTHDIGIEGKSSSKLTFLKATFFCDISPRTAAAAACATCACVCGFAETLKLIALI